MSLQQPNPANVSMETLQPLKSAPSGETKSLQMQPQQQAQIPGPKILLMGDSGTGKTQALSTLIEAGVTPFVIATEQNFLQVAKPFLNKLHYKYIAPVPDTSWSNMEDMLKKINVLSYENLCKTVDPLKQTHNKILEVVAACNEFICDCHGTKHGSSVHWGTDRALVIDSFSGLSDMAFALVVGNKPVRAMPDYGVAQNALKMFLNKLTTDLKCIVVLIAHLEREKDELTGGTTITVKTIGQKLGPDIPRLFSDVIRTRRDGATFSWDTADTQSTVVARHLPIASNQRPSFVPIINKWKELGGKISG